MSDYNYGDKITFRSVYGGNARKLVVIEVNDAGDVLGFEGTIAQFEAEFPPPPVNDGNIWDSRFYIAYPGELERR